MIDWNGWSKKAIVMVVFALIIFMGAGHKVSGAIAGKGTKNKPYIATAFNELEYALTSGKNTNGTTYVEVSGTISMEKNINIEGGTFYIYAHNSGALITKSTNPKDKMNEEKDPRYCFRIGLEQSTVVEIGCRGTNTLTLEGEKSYYEGNNKVSSGWMHVGEKGTVYLGNKAHVRNMINNDPASNLSNIAVYGYLSVDCIIENCRSKNGGAICVKQAGFVEIFENACIQNCVSDTEGGAIWIKEASRLIMHGGCIQGNTSTEEGGGIFASDVETYAEIISGSINHNQSGQSAGGIFAGYGATLVIGKSGANSGPIIEQNVAGGSGGGIRPNGGVTATAGGQFYFYSGIVRSNSSGKHGGGIAVGAPGSNGAGYVHMDNARVENNVATGSGGGIYLSNGNTGESGSVNISNCTIVNNSSEEEGGGMFVNTSLKLRRNNIDDNRSLTNGGGIYIAESAKVYNNDGTISDNESGRNGEGIYIKGEFLTGGNAHIGSNNEIYICRDKYINIYEHFTYSGSQYFVIDSAVKDNGTKLVYVTYSGGTGESLLYGNNAGEEDEYENESISKTMIHNNLTSEKILRSASKVSGVGDKWIIISTRYKITYDVNANENVAMEKREQSKFYQEEIKISGEIPEREEYAAIMASTWNEKKDGTGKVYSPNSNYNENRSMTLYIIWKKILIITITADDRYYLVGQDIELNEDEILRKVFVTDNFEDDYNYKVIIKKVQNANNKKIIFNNNSGMPENTLSQYLSTADSGDFEITLFTENINEKTQKEKVLNVHICNEEDSTQRVRFISDEYLNTIRYGSMWRLSKNKNMLKNIFKTKAKYTWTFHSEKLKEIKKFTEATMSIRYSTRNKMFYETYMGGK